MLDGDDGRSTYASYSVESSSAQATAICNSSSTIFSLVAGFESIPDSDTDTILDAMNNCTQITNLNQRDTEGDGFGNICDPDFDNNLVVNFADPGYLKSTFFTANADVDLNGDSSVNFGDPGILKSLFFKPPDPSGLTP